MTKGTYFLGSTSLAIPMENFSARYPTFLADMEAIIATVPSERNRQRCRVAMRLFVNYIGLNPQLVMLDAALASPSKDRFAPLGGVIETAAVSFYEFFMGIGDYSELSARSNAKLVAFVFRRLGEDASGPYPSISPKIRFREPFTGGVRASKLPRPIEPIENHEIEDHFGDQLAKDLAAYKGANEPKKVLGFRYFLSWLVNVADETFDLVRRALRGDCTSYCDPAAVKNALDECDKFMYASKAFAAASIRSRKADSAFLLQHLGRLADRTYPKVKRGHIKSVHVMEQKASEGLAQLALPGTEDLTGAALLRKSLLVIQDAAFEVLLQHVHVFETLSPARENLIPDELGPRQRKALKAIALVMQAEIDSLKQSGYSQFSSRGVRPDKEAAKEAFEKLSKASTWRDAGLKHLVPREKNLKHIQIKLLLNAGIGAVRASVLAAKVIFCTDTGWNRQPIDSLPISPILFEIGGVVGVASAKFVTEFKRRAGHNVLAMLQTSIASGGMKEAAVLAAWETTERAQRWDKSDERSILKHDTPAYKALKLIRPLVEALQDYKMPSKLAGKLFKYLTWSGGISADDREITTSFKEGILAIKGVTFDAIRKAVLRLAVRTIGSVHGVRAKAGHASTAVLLGSYLNSPDTIRELSQSTRFFQKAMQSLLIADVGSSLEIAVAMSAEDHEWFFNLAHASGVASAVGYGVSFPVGGIETLVFKPTAARIRELVSLELSLEAFRRTATTRRWALVGVPLLGYVTAIKQKLEKASLGRLIDKAHRKLVREIGAGKIVLRPLSLT